MMRLNLEQLKTYKIYKVRLKNQDTHPSYRNSARVYDSEFNRIEDFTIELIPQKEEFGFFIILEKIGGTNSIGDKRFYFKILTSGGIAYEEFENDAMFYEIFNVWRLNQN